MRFPAMPLLREGRYRVSALTWKGAWFMTIVAQSAVEFFVENAGYSYNPKTETPEEGQRRTAMALAEAEREGSDAGLSFSWDVDEEYSDGLLWVCICRSVKGEVLAVFRMPQLGSGARSIIRDQVSLTAYRYRFWRLIRPLMRFWR